MTFHAYKLSPQTSYFSGNLAKIRISRGQLQGPTLNSCAGCTAGAHKSPESIILADAAAPTRFLRGSNRGCLDLEHLRLSRPPNSTTYRSKSLYNHNARKRTAYSIVTGVGSLIDLPRRILSCRFLQKEMLDIKGMFLMHIWRRATPSHRQQHNQFLSYDFLVMRIRSGVRRTTYFYCALMLQKFLQVSN